MGEKRILLGVSGGIAAYKSAELVRRLRERGAEVRVVMTPSACQFITPLTLQAVSGRPVSTELLDPAAEAAMGHIELARWAELVLVAPATADLIARLAHGLADDLLTTLCLATRAPLALAPAMNQQMWLAPATQANVATLRARGVRLLGPEEGAQACGETGPGRMVEPEAIAEALFAPALPGPLAGTRVLVTAGPTREALDPVRYLSNRSSGRMGFAVARAAQQAGARVTLVSGPVSLPAPEQVRRIDVVSAQQMLEACEREVDAQDIVVAAAAVADYRPVAVAPHKMKKEQGTPALTLEHTPDILASLASRPRRPFLVGFAAETQDVEAHARRKLERKSLDMIAANDVGIPGLGFESDDNALQVIWREGGVVLTRASKELLARQLVDLIAERYRASRPA